MTVHQSSTLRTIVILIEAISYRSATFAFRTACPIMLCYTPPGSTSSRPSKASEWSGNSTDVLFVLLCFQGVMLALIVTGGEDIPHDYGTSTRVSRVLRMPGREVKG